MGSILESENLINDSGSLYHNYKGSFSVVLMGLVDPDYKFIWIDTGGFSHLSDSQIFHDSELNECILNVTIGWPPPDKLPGDDKVTPYFTLGNDIFALHTYLSKPLYLTRFFSKEQRIFNYRISRERRVVENAFGILAQRWQILLRTMKQVSVYII